MGKKLTTEEFIEKAIKMHGDRYAYSLVEYVNARTKVKISCKEHGEFLQSPNSHLSNHGCPKCGTIDSNINSSKTTEDFKYRASIIHNNKYSYINSIYLKSDNKLSIICEEHGEFLQTPANHLKGSGCPKCIGRNKNTEEFIEEANKIHNNRYTYSNAIYTYKHIPVYITCAIHGNFLQKPENHLSGNGCQKCGIDSNNIGNLLRSKKCANEFIESANKTHNNKYTYDNFVYINGKTKSIITCQIHGDFTQRPESHISGSGCPCCAISDRAILKINIASNKFIEQSNRVHNNLYTYENVKYIGSHVMVDITCPIHGNFNQAPTNHLSGSGCPTCTPTRYSKLSIKWLESIAKKENIFIQHADNVGEYKITGTRFRADGYCSENNTIYEFHGDCWHGNPNKYKPDDKPHYFQPNITAKELYEKTIERENLIKSLGYNLVVMWESDYR